MMKVMYIINNYQLGSRMRMTPVDKIVEKQRIDKSHTKVVYECCYMDFKSLYLFNSIFISYYNKVDYRGI